MNARWELAAALTAAGLLVALGMWTASTEPMNDALAEPARTPSPAFEPERDRATAGGNAPRRVALPAVTLSADVGAAIADARSAARAEDERDGLTRELETRAVEIPERRARTVAVDDLTARLGFQPGSRDGEDLARWLEESARADRDVLADAAQVIDARPDRAVAFNAAAEERGRALVERFGAPAAEEIARRFPIHRLDPQSGALERVDPHGRPLRLTGQD